MQPSDPLVLLGLPVRNGADRIGDVVRSVLAQDYSHIELVICDNVSTDNTEMSAAIWSALTRIVLRPPAGQRRNTEQFLSAIQIAKGDYFRWIGDYVLLAPDFVSRTLECFAEDDRRLR